MILEALRVLLFGMLGIFLVMAIIYGVIVLLSRISARAARKAEAEVIPIDVDGGVAEVDGGAPVHDDFGAGGFGDGYVIEDQYVVDDGYDVGEYGGGQYSDDQNADDEYGDEAYGGDVVYEYEGNVEYAEPEFVEGEVEVVQA